MTKKTLIALTASLGLGLLPIGLMSLAGCGDDSTEVNPVKGDAGTDAPKEGGDSGGDAGGDAAKPDTGTDSGGGNDSGGTDSGGANDTGAG